MAFCSNNAVLHADEVKAFKFTGYEGYVEARYREDERSNIQGSTVTFENRTSIEGEIFLLTHSYIYHPKFLKMDLGLGPVFMQNELETTFGSRRQYEDEYNLLARLNFLEAKPYPVLLYYSKDHPSVSLTLTDVFRQQNEKYGFDSQLRQPLLPFEVRMGASRNRTKGNGFEVRVDDTIDQATVIFDIPVEKDGYGKFTYNSTELTSSSGFIVDPVVTTVTKTESSTLDSRIFLGDKNQYQLYNLLSYIEQGGARPSKELRYTPDLRWFHTENLQSFYRFNYLDSEQEIVQTNNIGANAGFRYSVKENFNVDVDVHADEQETTGLKVANYGTSGNLNYKYPFSNGALNLSAGLAFNNFDRKNTQPILREDFRTTLVGTTPVFLPDENIIQTTIRVFQIFSGAPGDDPSQLTVAIDTFCGDLDPNGDPYDILAKTVGVRTTIENCNGASDGTIEVSVDYFYDPGGTVDFNNFSQTYQATLELQNLYSIYASYGRNDVNINSGEPTTPLDEHENKRLGATVDYPVFRSLKVGGELTYEEERGTLLAYDKQALRAYIQFNLLNGTFRLRNRQVIVDYFDTAEDVDLVRNSFQYRLRPWHGLRLSIDVSDEQNTGGQVNRRTKIYALNAQWQIRRLIFLAEGRKVDELFGINGQNRMFFRFSMRREF